MRKLVFSMIFVKYIFLFILILFTLNCTHQVKLKSIVDSELVEVYPSKDKNYDYGVMMVEGKMHDWHTSNISDRQYILQYLFEDRCRNGIDYKEKRIKLSEQKYSDELTGYAWAQWVKCK